MKKIIGYAVVVLCFFMFRGAEAAIFDVTNVTQLQNALTTAQSNGQDDTINLAAGTYTLSSSLNYSPSATENFSLMIQGAGAWATILDGGNSTSILRIEQVDIEDGTNANVTITGVTFQNGNESSLLGGALYIGNYYAQTTIADSVFQNNTAVLGGGAFYLTGLDAHIAGNAFSGNSSTDLSSQGGAVCSLISGGTLSLEGNTFSDNFSVGSGAGIYATNSGPIVLTGNVFSGNVAGGEGGGAYVSAESGESLTLSGNEFSGNSGSSGGGALLYSQSGPVIISGNIFRDNIASTSSGSDGGGLTVSIFFAQGSLKMVNNLFADNTTSQRGAGAKINLFSNENQITNNTFVGNSSTGTYDPGGSLGGGMYVKADRNEAVLNIYNNIFWANMAAAPSHSGADAYINDDGFNDAVGCTIHLYNNDLSNIEIVRGDHLFQGGNINGNPRFDSDYRLTAGPPDSPCIDAGDNSAPGLLATDLGGDPRIHGTIVDMGAYEWKPSGSLTVTISPQGAVDAGAQWRVDGGVWHGSGETQTNLSEGGHTLEFRDIAGWTKPVDEQVTIPTAVTRTYIPTGSTGSLQVTIEPAGAREAGAQWQVDGGVWHGSEYTQTGLLAGDHTVGFSDVSGLTNPGIQTVTISGGGTATLTGTYTGTIGSLRVTIEPQEARLAGARWRVAGGAWHVSGYLQTVSVGSRTVEFSDLVGWTKPNNQTVTITNGGTTNSSGTYTQPTGSLRVTIEPPGLAGAQWRRVGMSTWRDSGTTETGIRVGPYAVEFKDVSGWTKPGNRTVTISNDQTTNSTGTYTEKPKGSLRVTIEPQGPIDAGAQWRVDGGDWHASEYTQEGLVEGEHLLEFSDVVGWAKPGNRMVTINNGQTATATGTYTPPASNSVYPAEGTMGTELTITGSGFGTKKGKVLIGNTSVRNTSLTILSWNDGLISCRLAKAIAPGDYDVTIVPIEPKGSPSIIYNEAFVVKSPEIYSIDPGEGTAWEQITIRGKFFGTSKGKIYLEYYEEGGEPVRKNCKVNSWTMDRTIGDAEIVFVVPPMLPEVCNVVVDPYGALPETEEAGGFTVKAPEIVTVNPNVGTTGDAITVHGYFFGTKKPKIYLLGYNMNGKPIKKPCSVVSWTVVNPTTQEGEIVFKVPGGLAPGVYDLTVTNSVGSDAVSGGFTVRAPEIVSVVPNAGTNGDPITIHGNFFGTIKPKVYLGYSVNGKSIKKPCSVVSWPDDPTTQEGDIVFNVPTGLAIGTYDVIVTNSAGSDSELDIFTIQ